MKAEQLRDMTNMLDISETKDKYLTFWAGERIFGVSIADVVQIVQMQPFTEVPEFPDYARGIITLRGSIIPIVDVRKRFHMPDREYDDRTCIIVCSIAGDYLGFIVDRVDEVTFISQEEIAQPPSIAETDMADYLMGVSQREQHLILLMDMKNFLTQKQRDKLKQTM